MKADVFPTQELIAVLRAFRRGDFSAGASDYIAKPVDLDRLYSLMRVWLKP